MTRSQKRSLKVRCEGDFTVTIIETAQAFDAKMKTNQFRKY